MMESTESWTATQLPPGFRFHPTDEELVVHYLKKRAASTPLPVPIIAEVDIYKFDPWELPAKATFGEEEWYFFSPRDRKYPNGVRPNRAATSGYWKATGTDKPVLSSGGATQIMVGVKKALVFYGGRPPKGIKTSWIMHEYRLADKKVISPKPPPYNMANKKGSLRLDDWVLCRIYKKSNSQRAVEHDMVESSRIPASTGLDIGKQNPNVHEVVEGSILHSALLQNDEDKLLEALGEQMKNDDLIDMNINGGCVSSSMPQLPNLVAFTLDTHPSDLHTVKYHGADEEGSFGKTDESNNPFATLLNYQLPQAAHPSLQYQQTYHHQQHTSSAINWYI